jgi:hypothetical protein
MYFDLNIPTDCLSDLYAKSSGFYELANTILEDGFVGMALNEELTCNLKKDVKIGKKALLCGYLSLIEKTSRHSFSRSPYFFAKRALGPCANLKETEFCCSYKNHAGNK